MKIEISIRKTPIQEEYKTITTSEKLLYASPCQLKFQDEWFNEILKNESSEKIHFYDQEDKLTHEQMIPLYVKSLLHVQFVTNANSFLDWWCNLLDLSQDQKEQAFASLKKIGINEEKLNQRWTDLNFNQKIFIILAPAATRFKVIHLFLGDYFIEQDDLEIFCNQIHPYLNTAQINLVLFWTLSFRNLKGHRLYFSGFNGEVQPEK